MANKAAGRLFAVFTSERRDVKAAWAEISPEEAAKAAAHFTRIERSNTCEHKAAEAQAAVSALDELLTRQRAEDKKAAGKDWKWHVQKMFLDEGAPLAH